MGGSGALHLGMKHPMLFGAISAVAPAILQDLKDEPRERTFDAFGDDEAHYDANGPWSLAREHAQALRTGCAIRVLSGDADARLRAAISGFGQLLSQFGIPHTSTEVMGAGHDYKAIVGGLGDEGFAFWHRAFEPSARGARWSRKRARYVSFATTSVRSSRSDVAPTNEFTDARIASRTCSGGPPPAAASVSRSRPSPYSSSAALTASTRPSE